VRHDAIALLVAEWHGREELCAAHLVVHRDATDGLDTGRPRRIPQQPQQQRAVALHDNT
jgi:hypothetical protein